MAGLARGSVFRVASTADAAFSRLALELSGYYLLSFEPETEDRDGKVHKIKIGVPGRNGIEIRSRAQFAVEPARAITNETLLSDALRAPLLATDIGLKVSTYTLRDAADRQAAGDRRGGDRSFRHEQRQTRAGVLARSTREAVW